MYFRIKISNNFLLVNLWLCVSYDYTLGRKQFVQPDYS
jgi:hypothetical protein